MRHRLANKSLSRPTAHRLLMLRNLVSSLLLHESITTTLTKAKETQKLAEKVIGWGKKGGKPNHDRAQAWLLNPNETMSPLFGSYAERYATRPGGYTRIHRVGHRVGDNAPLAVLELVDSSHDLKFESTARIVGREMAIRAKEGAGPEGWWSFRGRVEQSEGGSQEGVISRIAESVELDPLTRKNVVKVLRYRVETFVAGHNVLPSVEEVPEADESSSNDQVKTYKYEPTATVPTIAFLDRTHHHYLRTLATLSLSTTPTADPVRILKQLSSRLNPTDERGPPRPVLTVPIAGRTYKAGERLDGWESLKEGETVMEVEKRGGPIGRAKGSKGRQARREVWTGTKRSEEELAAA